MSHVLGEKARDIYDELGKQICSFPELIIPVFDSTNIRNINGIVYCIPRHDLYGYPQILRSFSIQFNFPSMIFSINI